MMKYLLLEFRKQEKQTLLDNIATSLWNDGKEEHSLNKVNHNINSNCCET